MPPGGDPASGERSGESRSGPIVTPLVEALAEGPRARLADLAYGRAVSVTASLPLAASLPSMTVRSQDSPLRWPLRAGWRPVPAWRRYLTGARAEVILEQLLRGDPLRVRALAAERITLHARLVDVDRVVLRALARIAHGAALRGPSVSEGWLREQMDGAIAEVVEQGAAPETAPGPFLEALAPGAGLTREALGRACVAFNRRSGEERAAFWATVVAGEPMEVAARREGVAAAVVARRSRSVLAALVRAAGEEGAA